MTDTKIMELSEKELDNVNGGGPLGILHKLGVIDLSFGMNIKANPQNKLKLPGMDKDTRPVISFDCLPHL